MKAIETMTTAAAVLALGLLASTPASAFQVLPKISDVDRKLAGLGSNRLLDWTGQFLTATGLPLLKSPVHESIVLSAVGCTARAGEEASCVTAEAVRTNQILLYGVRWPDDPPFPLNRASPPRINGCDPRVTLRSTAQPKCWLGLFRDADKTAKVRLKGKRGAAAFGPGDYLLARSHFGDLQFFHSMAAFDGEPPGATQQRMKMWAKFLWGVATKSLPLDQPIRTLGIDGLSQYMPGEMTATNLLATGIVEVRRNLDQVAVGALLHMVQDSFSSAHTGRATEPGGKCPSMPRFNQPGRIVQFYSYAGQVGSKHDHEDTFDALGLQTLQTSPNVVDVSRAFLTLWKEGAPWQEAEKYFDCVFALSDAQAEAGPGPFQ